MDAQVLAVSTDFIATLTHWSKELNATYPLLSDHERTTAKAYGVLNEQYGIANRSTFLIDLDGKIAHIEEGNSAMDPTGAETACKRVKHIQ